MRLIVTRPAQQAAGWVQALRAQGLDAHALPLIGIAPLQDTAPVQAAWHELDSFALVMFVSANAVQQFFAARPTGAGWPDTLWAGSTGPGTTQALRELGVTRIEEPAADAAQFDSEALWSRLRHQDWHGRHVLLVRGEQGRDWLADTLRQQDARVHALPAYRRLPPALDADMTALLAAAQARPDAHRWLFSSSEAVQQLQALAPAVAWSSHHAWCSHPRIAQTAREAGFGLVREMAPGIDAVVALARQGA